MILQSGPWTIPLPDSVIETSAVVASPAAANVLPLVFMLMLFVLFGAVVRSLRKEGQDW